MPYSALSDDISTVSQFTRRKEITITTDGTSTQAYYQVKLTITYEVGMQADFDDIRFNTKSSGYIDYWIETYTASTTAIVWIELPDVITDPGSDKIWMYYGNPDLSNGANGDDTFEFFDDFTGDLSKWTIEGGAWSLSNERLYCNADSTEALIRTASYNSFANNILECDWQFINWTTGIREGVLIRLSDISNYYAMWLTARAATGNEKAVFIETKVDNVWGGGEDFALQDFTTGVWYSLKYIANGISLSAYFDNVEKVSTTRTNFASGRIGFRTYVDDIYVNNVRVRKHIVNEPTILYGSSQHQRRIPQFIG